MEQLTNHTALLVMDVQMGIIGRLPNAEELISKVSKAIASARNRQIPVIYVVVGFRPGAPEVSMDNKSFAAGKEMFANVSMEEFMQIYPDVAPQADEITVVKRRVSAFTGSDLDVVLRAKGIRHLVLMGVSTSGVVLSTVREAADKDFKLTVLSDCCADPDAEVHQILTTKVFPRQAEVVEVGEWTHQ